MTIQRYRLDKLAPGMFKESLGPWVKHSDHLEALAAQRAESSGDLPAVDREALEAIGQTADTLDALIFASSTPLDPKTHVEQMQLQMKRCRDVLRRAYTKLSGNNPWENSP